MLDDRDHRDFAALQRAMTRRLDTRRTWLFRAVLGAAAIGLVLLGYAIAWLIDHSAAPPLIALAQVLR